MWNESDQIGFKEASNKNIGQFPKNTDLWNVLVEMARDTQNRTFSRSGHLEWSGKHFSNRRGIALTQRRFCVLQPGM